MIEKDMDLMLDGMGIVFFSPETTKDIEVGDDFFDAEYQEPEDVARHLQKGDVVGFCTGTGGDFTLKFREGYPSEEVLGEYPLWIRLGIELKDGKMCVADLFDTMDWPGATPDEQIVETEPGFYHLTVGTKRPESGIWGDYQTICVYMNRLEEMPKLKWEGVPFLCED